MDTTSHPRGGFVRVTLHFDWEIGNLERLTAAANDRALRDVPKLPHISSH